MKAPTIKQPIKSSESNCKTVFKNATEVFLKTVLQFDSLCLIGSVACQMYKLYRTVFSKAFKFQI